ncbi:MAG: hypothetical protein ACD_3C00049G0013 [uncultured bacterium (gcode 4)]|uniref:Uncharacterized protein n=1 Tax=uncultured bacterium (gcode 4) TaxID=1234023 RepID=K2FBM5_9BACT|nr:MAG: hypothetical protein ACD_3C00049G0013 [uncultured bacterium (gcode 4)]
MTWNGKKDIREIPLDRWDMEIHAPYIENRSTFLDVSTQVKEARWEKAQKIAKILEYSDFVEYVSKHSLPLFHKDEVPTDLKEFRMWRKDFLLLIDTDRMNALKETEKWCSFQELMNIRFYIFRDLHWNILALPNPFYDKSTFGYKELIEEHYQRNKTLIAKLISIGLQPLKEEDLNDDLVYVLTEGLTNRAYISWESLGFSIICDVENKRNSSIK